jgi:hypothetical protein
MGRAQSGVARTRAFCEEIEKKIKKKNKRMLMNDVFVSRCNEQEFHTVSKTAQRPRETRSVSTTVLRQPPSQAAFGFLDADVTSAVIGNADNNREA